jgi:RHS repeat-associated protein
MVYDAEGERLVRDDGDTVTAFLPQTELTWDRTTDTVEGTRYFSHAGQVVAVCTGRDAADWTFIGADHHGTTTTHSVNAFTAVEQVRRMDPYGNPRGAPPATWPGQQGFVGGVEDPTGLVHIGARSYDPATGRFMSVDPILAVGDDQQINGYAYANNNPVTFTDPTGQCTITLSRIYCPPASSYMNGAAAPGAGPGAGSRAAPPGHSGSSSSGGCYTTPYGNFGCGPSSSSGAGGTGAQDGCIGNACPDGTPLSCQSSNVDIGGSINFSTPCPQDDTNPPYMSLGQPPRYCDFWYHPMCGRLTNAEIGLDVWWSLSCLSGLVGLDNGLACELMEHYMGATGEDVPVDVDMLLASPEFSESVYETMMDVIEMAKGMCESPPCTYTFDSGWKSMSFEEHRSEDLFYGYRGMTYQVEGAITVETGPDGETYATGTYTTNAYKAWNFDPGYSQGMIS